VRKAINQGQSEDFLQRMGDWEETKDMKDIQTKMDEIEENADKYRELAARNAAKRNEEEEANREWEDQQKTEKEGEEGGGDENKKNVNSGDGEKQGSKEDAQEANKSDGVKGDKGDKEKSDSNKEDAKGKEDDKEKEKDDDAKGDSFYQAGAMLALLPKLSSEEDNTGPGRLGWSAFSVEVLLLQSKVAFDDMILPVYY
jgi:hypothetical protein